MRNRDRQPRDPKFPHRAQKFPQIPHQERHKHRIKFAPPRKRRVLCSKWRKRIPDGIADHAKHAGATRNFPER